MGLSLSSIPLADYCQIYPSMYIFLHAMQQINPWSFLIFLYIQYDRLYLSFHSKMQCIINNLKIYYQLSLRPIACVDRPNTTKNILVTALKVKNKKLDLQFLGMVLRKFVQPCIDNPLVLLMKFVSFINLLTY